MVRVLTAQDEDFPRWYQDVVAKAELAEAGPVRGTQVIRPTGYALWERMQVEIDDRIKAAGAQNCSFPLLIPESYLRREAEHVEGFSPELAVVTHAGGKQLTEPVVVRPTSETIFGEFMAKWVSSYRDLPLLLNQWANVMRWEMRTRLFLRSSEFLWQEGHTAHVTAADARAYARRILHETYEDFMVNVLAIPAITGLKTTRERFAGAVRTYTVEAMMRDRKALQMGTSHELGQNFSKAFDITYSSATGEAEYAWTTSWGSSTRMMGGLIMSHGDDNGLRVPPRLAPVQVLVTVIKAGDGVAESAGQLHSALTDAGLRAALDERTDIPFGRRAIDAELKGYPVRVEIGPRDLAIGKVTLVRRVPGTKITISRDRVVPAVIEALTVDQQALYDEAQSRREYNTVTASTLDEALEAAQHGWARVPWSMVGTEGEATAADAGLTVRCLVRPDSEVPDAENEPELVAVMSRAY